MESQDYLHSSYDVWTEEFVLRERGMFFEYRLPENIGCVLTLKRMAKKVYASVFRCDGVITMWVLLKLRNNRVAWSDDYYSEDKSGTLDEFTVQCPEIGRILNIAASGKIFKPSAACRRNIQFSGNVTGKCLNPLPSIEQASLPCWLEDGRRRSVKLSDVPWESCAKMDTMDNECLSDCSMLSDDVFLSDVEMNF